MWFGLLGPLAARTGDRSLTVSGAKSRALLAALLFQANRAVPLASLQAALWGDALPATAAASLNNHAGRLRRALGPEGTARLKATPYGLLLRVEADELDIQQLSAALSGARYGRERSDWATVWLRTTEALALWRGEPLSDLGGGHGLHAEVEHLRQSHLQALEWHFEAALELGQHAEVTPELSRRAAQHPLHEALHIQLMTALYRSGRQADALDAFERIRAALAEELGIDPGAALRTLHQRVLRSDPVLLQPPAAAAGSATATAHPAPEPKDQGSKERAEAKPADGAAPAPIPAQLPADALAFTGRVHELAALRRWLQEAADGKGTRVALVSGMGGVGKSALAIHAAHQLRELFPDGQLYLDLNGFGALAPRSPDEVLAILISDMHRGNAPSHRLPESLEQRAALLRSILADRRVLVILDNARDSAQVLPLLPGSGHSAVIVTSRHGLTDLPGRQITLDPMDVEEQRELLSALCGSERLQEDPHGELKLLAACAGLPLALRITGARLAARPVWSMTMLAEQMEKGRLTSMSAGHLGVRDTFASSYHALDSESARGFRLMGLWPGQALSAGAAAALLNRSPAETINLLEGLVDANLLQSDEPLRYRFHDLLGEYAAEQAAAGETARERELAKLRLCTWYTLALERARAATGVAVAVPPRLQAAPPADLPAFADEANALSWCRHELANVREAIRQAGSIRRSDLSWRLAVDLYGYMLTYWWTGQWEECLTQALQIATEHSDRVGTAWLLRTLGACHGIARRDNQAVEALQAALPLFDDPEGKVAILSNLSIVCGNLGQTAQALRHARAAFDLHVAEGNPERIAPVLSTLGDALRVAHHYEEAELRYRQALGAWQERSNAGGVAITQANLGDVLRGLNRRDEALASHAEALRFSRQRGLTAWSAEFLILSARAHAHFTDWESAEADTREAIELAELHNLTTIQDEARNLLKTIEAARCTVD